jgi:peroxiredoxin-like protein
MNRFNYWQLHDPNGTIVITFLKFIHFAMERRIDLSKVISYNATGNWSPSTGTSIISTTHVSVQLTHSSAQAAESSATPEELLLSAAAGCYLQTLLTLLNNRNVSYQKISLESVGHVIDDSGLRFDRIEHYPTITLDDSQQTDLAVLLTEHAEHTCMVSSALRGNVQVVVQPRILVQAVQ